MANNENELESVFVETPPVIANEPDFANQRYTRADDDADENDDDQDVRIDDEDVQNNLYYHENFENGQLNHSEVQAFIYRAAMEGDWKLLEPVLTMYRDELVLMELNQSGDLALHISAAAGKTKFVQKLVKMMDPSQVKTRNGDGSTAFSYAVAAGAVDIAKIMCYENAKSPNSGDYSITTIPDELKMIPLYVAILLGHEEMVSYLHKVTPLKDVEIKDRIKLVQAAIHVDMFDIALYIVQFNYGKYSSETKMKALQLLARKPFALPSGSKRRVWNRVLNYPAASYLPCMRGVQKDLRRKEAAYLLVKKLWSDIMKLPEETISFLFKKYPILHDAAKVGNINFVKIIIGRYPNLIWNVDSNDRTMFHTAVLNRQENVFSLIFSIGGFRQMITLLRDTNNDTMLHMVGTKPPVDRLKVVSGAALQIQRELLWFQGVEKILPASFLTLTNTQKKTPRELFTENHETMLKDGEKWMKNTANSCMLVATLIATVVFAAAFTVPGGNNSDTGIPYFVKSRWFMVFAISVAVALFTSIVSIIFFLAVLTSRFAEEDFLVSLPTKLMCGLISLFLSIVSMVLGFASSFFVIYDQQFSWVPKLISGFACFSVALFVMFHGKLWIDVISSTYRSNFLFNPAKIRFL